MKNIVILVTAFCCFLMNRSKAQTAAADNKLSQTITFRPIAKGPTVYGVFEGRPPCAGIVEQLHLTTDAGCVKLKWSLTLYQDSVNFQPTNFNLTIVGSGEIVQQEGSSYRLQLIKGEWMIIKGMKSNPDAAIYRLAFGQPATYLYLLKGDDNVLFVLDANKEFSVGNEDFSYTLNRVELVPGNK